MDEYVTTEYNKWKDYGIIHSNLPWLPFSSSLFLSIYLPIYVYVYVSATSCGPACSDNAVQYLLDSRMTHNHFRLPSLLRLLFVLPLLFSLSVHDVASTQSTCCSHTQSLTHLLASSLTHPPFS